MIVVLVQRASGLIKKNSNSIQEVCNAGLSLAYEIEFRDDLEGWNEEETDEVTVNEPYSLGKDLLSKTAKALSESAL